MPEQSNRRRAGLIVSACVALCAAIASLIAADALSRPAIRGISPAIAEPGDELEIRGRNFGQARRDSRVSVGGSFPTSSSYLSWSDEAIRVRVPATAQSGLVRVVKGRRWSNGLLFTNRTSLPRPAADSLPATGPSLRSAAALPSGKDAAVIAVGTELVLSGLNFGVNQEEGLVLFSAAMEARPEGPPSATDSGYLASPLSDYAYGLWSDNEIRVRIPDGAATGTYFVRTARGLSNALYLELGHPVGNKVFRDRKTYVIRYSVDISGVKASGANSLYLWVPRPLSTASQRSVRSVTMNRKPTVENFKETMLYRFEGLRDGQSFQTSHDFILDAYEVECQPKVEAMRPAAPSPLQAAFTRAEPQVPSADARVVAKAAELSGKERNPWRVAKRIYDWMTSGELTLEPGHRDSGALSLLSSGKGDAWSAAMLFSALCRASGVPAAPCAGVLVDGTKAALPHWWAEFWVDGLGWVPVDPAMGALMDLPSPKPPSERKAWYFGHADSFRIAFSRGFTDLGRQVPGSRLKPAGRFYALQSITEEAAGPISSYTAFWSDIVVVGVY